jgi:hypothetical protein
MVEALRRSEQLVWTTQRHPWERPPDGAVSEDASASAEAATPRQSWFEDWRAVRDPA